MLVGTDGENIKWAVADSRAQLAPRTTWSILPVFRTSWRSYIRLAYADAWRGRGAYTDRARCSLRTPSDAETTSPLRTCMSIMNANRSVCISTVSRVRGTATDLSGHVLRRSEVHSGPAPLASYYLRVARLADWWLGMAKGGFYVCLRHRFRAFRLLKRAPFPV